MIIYTSVYKQIIQKYAFDIYEYTQTKDIKNLKGLMREIYDYWGDGPDMKLIFSQKLFNNIIIKLDVDDYTWNRMVTDQGDKRILLRINHGKEMIILETREIWQYIK